MTIGIAPIIRSPLSTAAVNQAEHVKKNFFKTKKQSSKINY